MVAHRRAALSCSRRSPRGRTSDLGAPREPRAYRCTGSAAGERVQRHALWFCLSAYSTRLSQALVGSVDPVCPGLTAPAQSSCESEIIAATCGALARYALIGICPYRALIKPQIYSNSFQLYELELARTNSTAVATNVPASASVIESEDGSMGFCEASAAPCFAMVDEPRGSCYTYNWLPLFLLGVAVGRR